MIKVDSFDQRFCAEIAKGFPSLERGGEMVEVFHNLVSDMSKPVSHGTSSEHLKSILENHLGGVFPEYSFSPGRISVTDLTYADGLYASYPFALRKGVFFNSGLSLDARYFGGRNVVQRYTAALGLEGMRARTAEMKLGIAGILYCLRKRSLKGWPTLLIYDTRNEIELVKLKDKITFVKIPSDFAASSPLPKEMLSLALVPARNYQETKQIITGYGLQTPILPLEIIELEEILQKS